MANKRSSGDGAARPEPPAEAPFELTLRDVEPALAPSQSAPPVDDGLVESDAGSRAAPWLGDPDAERAAQRAARRAQVRRDRQRDTPADDAAAAPEVLVLSADDAACAALHALLQAFGFAVRVLRAAPDLPAPWPYVAVFVTAPMGSGDGGDTIDLCSQVRETSRLPGEKKPVLVLATLQLSATDRVRAGLAGCNEVLLGAPTRGAVAQLLDARGIALPSDARR